MNLTKTVFEFGLNGRIEKLTVYHNLRNVHGLSIDDAFDNWFFRSSKKTASSFCKYIMSKDVRFVAMTEAQWKRLNSA